MGDAWPAGGKENGQKSSGCSSRIWVVLPVVVIQEECFESVSTVSSGCSSKTCVVLPVVVVEKALESWSTVSSGCFSLIWVELPPVDVEEECSESLSTVSLLVLLVSVFDFFEDLW